MSSVWIAPLSILWLILSACALDNSIPGQYRPSIDDYTAPSINLRVQQNELFTQDLNPAPESFENLSLTVVEPPEHGQLSVSGSEITYQSHAFFSGSDSFQYTLDDGYGPSKVATATVTVSPLTTGTFSFTETFQGQQFQLPGWRSFQSSFGHAAEPIQSFGSGTFQGAPVDYRDLGVFVLNGSYRGNLFYHQLFSALPVDGTGATMNDWPWVADLLHRPECFYQVEVVGRFSYQSANPLVSLLLNYRISQSASQGTRLTGYQLLANSGGSSLTLSRFDGANETATAFLDRWPNTNFGNEAFANPVTHGPYRGWNYTRNTFPAGGNTSRGAVDVVLAAGYEYDPNTNTTTIGFEVRNQDGTDQTPGVWDVVVPLTGADSLPPGGGFGFMPVTYHHGGGTAFDSRVAISELSLSCVTP